VLISTIGAFGCFTVAVAGLDAQALAPPAPAVPAALAR
jgi:hypothetical protein